MIIQLPESRKWPDGHMNIGQNAHLGSFKASLMRRLHREIILCNLRSIGYTNSVPNDIQVKFFWGLLGTEFNLCYIYTKWHEENMSQIFKHVTIR